MLKKTITYVDYNGQQRTEDFYFNLTQAEIMEMEATTAGGYADMLQRIVDAQDQTAIFNTFKDIIMTAYGEKSPDGRRFVKTPEIKDAFVQTEAYSALIMEFFRDPNSAIEFANGILPTSVSNQTPQLTNAQTTG